MVSKYEVVWNGEMCASVVGGLMKPVYHFRVWQLDDLLKRNTVVLLIELPNYGHQRLLSMAIVI